MGLKCVAGGEGEQRWESEAWERWSETSALATVQRKSKPKEKKDVFLFLSPNITLTFFPLFHKNSQEEEVRTVHMFSNSRDCVEVFQKTLKGYGLLLTAN